MEWNLIYRTHLTCVWSKLIGLGFECNGQSSSNPLDVVQNRPNKLGPNWSTKHKLGSQSEINKPQIECDPNCTTNFFEKWVIISPRFPFVLTDLDRVHVAHAPDQKCTAVLCVMHLVSLCATWNPVQTRWLIRPLTQHKPEMERTSRAENGPISQLKP